jgi:hypothetical protein
MVRILTARAVLAAARAFFVLELVWAVVSAWGLFQTARGRRARPAY